MKILAMCVAAMFALMGAACAQDVNLLAVGNSFSWSAGDYLPRVVQSVPGCTLVFEHASIGGCPLKKHWELAEKSEADPEFKPYSDKSGKYSLKEKLQSRKWDFITMQQASGDSWQAGTFDPYAEKLYNYIKKYAPQAEVVIQQTWAYRGDEPRLKKWGIDQQEMFTKLTENYVNMAKKLNCRVLPVGNAVQLARETQKDKYVPYDPEAVKKLEHPAAFPDKKGSFVGGLNWWQDKKDGGKWKQGLDAYHLNNRGKYLQACVWFAILYGKPTAEIKFVPKEVAPEDAAFLRETAQKAVDGWKQVK